MLVMKKKRIGDARGDKDKEGDEVRWIDEEKGKRMSGNRKQIKKDTKDNIKMVIVIREE